MKIGGRIPWTVTAICETFKSLLADGKTPYERRFGMLFNGPVIPFGAMVEYHLFLRNTYRDCIKLIQKSCQVVMYCTRGEEERRNLERRHYESQTLKNWSRWTHPNSTPEGSMQRKC